MEPLIQTDNCPIKIPASFTSSSHEETFSLGVSFAQLLKWGSVVALRGPLGAGKTCFAKGVAQGLGVEEEVTSPTYTIIREYPAFPQASSPVTLFHIDAYRLKGNDDFTAIGGEEIIFSDGVSVIEWSERVEDFIPPEALRVDIAIDNGGKRLIDIYVKGEGN